MHNPIMERDDLMEYLTGAFIAGRDVIPVDFERREREAVTTVEMEQGRSCSDYALAYISRFYRALRGAYDLGRSAHLTGDTPHPEPDVPLLRGPGGVTLSNRARV